MIVAVVVLIGHYGQTMELVMTIVVIMVAILGQVVSGGGGWDHSFGVDGD